MISSIAEWLLVGQFQTMFCFHVSVIDSIDEMNYTSSWIEMSHNTAFHCKENSVPRSDELMSNGSILCFNMSLQNRRKNVRHEHSFSQCRLNGTIGGTCDTEESMKKLNDDDCLEWIGYQINHRRRDSFRRSSHVNVTEEKILSSPSVS